MISEGRSQRCVCWKPEGWCGTVPPEAPPGGQQLENILQAVELALILYLFGHGLRRSSALCSCRWDWYRRSHCGLSASKVGECDRMLNSGEVAALLKDARGIASSAVPEGTGECVGRRSRPACYGAEHRVRFGGQLIILRRTVPLQSWTWHGVTAVPVSSENPTRSYT